MRNEVTFHVHPLFTGLGWWQWCIGGVGVYGLYSGVTMGWLLRLVTGAPLVVGGPGSSTRVLGD